MTLSEYQHSITPKKCRLRERSTTSKRPHPETDCQESDSDMDEHAEEADLLPVRLQFEQLTRESDVRFYTGLTSTESFKCVFQHLLPMQHWHAP